MRRSKIKDSEDKRGGRRRDGGVPAQTGPRAPGGALRNSPSTAVPAPGRILYSVINEASGIMLML